MPLPVPPPPCGSAASPCPAPRPRPPAGRHQPAKNTRRRRQLVPVGDAGGGGGSVCPGSPAAAGSGHRGSPGHSPAVVPGPGSRPSVRPSLCRCLWAVPMAEKSDSRDSDGSWVLAGGEGLPVVTVGPEQDLESHGAEDEEPEEEDEEEGPQDTVTGRWQPQGRDRAGVPPFHRPTAILCLSPATAATGAAAFPGQAQHPESSELGDLEECWDTGAGAVPTSDASAEPSVPDGDEQEEPDAAAEPGPCPDTPKAGPPTEEGSCTSSDDDVEGLRRRQGHEPRPSAPRPTPTPRWVTPDAGAEDGLSMSKYLLGALALVAVGLLIVSGGIYDLADGPAESVLSRDAVAGEQESPLPTDGSDQQERPPMLDARDPQSVESMSLLLDKLAKENQEIRLMQAELQAHKEELHALLQKSEGEAAAAGAQQQSLAAENARLRAALEREAAALRDTRAELQRLRATGAAGTPGAGQPAAEQPPGASATARGEDAVRREGAWRHGWLGLVRQELAGALERARGPRGLEGLVEELSALEQRLGWELEAEEAEPFPRPWKKPFKAEKKEKRHKQHGAGGAPHERQRREQSKPHRHGKDPRPPREHKPDKAWGKSSRGPPQHGPRELPPLSRYRAPQGCSGVADCARKEGREVLGAALEPVQKTQFLQLLEGFMGRLGLGGHFGGLAARLDGAFGADGTFAHDRLRFVDFVDDVEELLEEVARRERGDEEAADGFEEYVLRHYTGDGGTGGKERGRRATWQRRAAG
ncbi:pre-B-cell leukemia transcription factor-interacting protein 1 isoform X2 [Phalacrocorax carbo]|uniref:pre-B-cell leukemia transcription factor-interacting protein 1 isoform X2 n=1 Tax=Phalacrocorax carbo TaxID=9209 RepID=UPI003119FADA